MGLQIESAEVNTAIRRLSISSPSPSPSPTPRAGSRGLGATATFLFFGSYLSVPDIVGPVIGLGGARPKPREWRAIPAPDARLRAPTGSGGCFPVGVLPGATTLETLIGSDLGRLLGGDNAVSGFRWTVVRTPTLGSEMSDSGFDDHFRGRGVGFECRRRAETSVLMQTYGSWVGL